MCIRDRIRAVCKTSFDSVWICGSYRMPSSTCLIKNVAGKLPLSLNRSSPKTTGLEYSTIEGCMQQIIWFCLNLRRLSFVIENTLLKHKTLEVNYPFPLTDTSPKTIGLENSIIQDCMRNIIWFWLNLSFIIEKITNVKT